MVKVIVIPDYVIIGFKKVELVQIDINKIVKIFLMLKVNLLIHVFNIVIVRKIVVDIL